MKRLDLAALAPEDASPTIYDFDGQVQDLAWLYEHFGDVTWQRADPHPDAPWVFRLVTLRAKCGPASLIVQVIDELDQPLEKYAVVRHWPGAPQLPDFSNTTAKQWTTHGVVGKTNLNGDVGFGMGTGDYYHPENGQTGASSVYVADFDGPGDFLQGLGMLGGTQHCHLDAQFQRLPKDEPGPPPPPPPGPDPEPGSWKIDLHITGSISPIDS